MMKSFLFAFLILIVPAPAQTPEITRYLQDIEQGKGDSVRSILTELKKRDPANPDVIFLDAVLTEDASEAVKKFKLVTEKYPQSKFADAAVYRLYLCYSAQGLYRKAEDYYAMLQKNYPASKYLTQDKLPEAETPAAVKQEKKEKKNFAVQAGAFLNQANADKMTRNLEQDGYKVSTQKKEIGGAVVIVVTAENFSKEEAADASKAIDKKYNLKSRVINKEQN